LKDRGQRGTELDCIELPDVLREGRVHLLFEIFEEGFVVRRPIWHNVVVVARIHEFKDAADKVSEVFQEQIVVGADERIPGELAIACFWPNRQQEEAPHIRRDACFLGGIPKHADATTFRELSPLVRQVVGGREVVEFRPAVMRAELVAGKIME
jgi:hypothetical protein